MPLPGFDAESCRLCSEPLPRGEWHRRLCPICDEYVQHLSLRGNRNFEDVVSDIRNAPAFAKGTHGRH
jgi:hypothetical protein